MSEENSIHGRVEPERLSEVAATGVVQPNLTDIKVEFKSDASRPEVVVVEGSTSLEISKEKLIKEMADSVKWFYTFGKVPVLDSDRNTMEFADLKYVRKPAIEGQAQPFVTDRYGSTIQRSLGRSKLSLIHYLSPNKQLVSPPGEVTIRYVGSDYENGKKGLILVLSLVHGMHPFDSRWNGHTDYVAFDLDETKGILFLEESIKDPKFVEAFLAEVVRQKPAVIESFTEPSYVVISTYPGLTAIDLDRSRTRDGKILKGSYTGRYVVSDGKSITRYPLENDTNTDLDIPDSDVVATLGIQIPDQPTINLNKELADKRYEYYHSIPEDIKTQIVSAPNLRAITELADSGRVEFLMKLADTLNDVHYGLVKILEKESDNADSALEKLLVKIPTDFGIREKVKHDFQTILNALRTLKLEQATPEQILKSIKDLASTADYIVFDNSYIDTNKLVQKLEKIIALKDKPVDFVELLTGISDGDILDYALDHPSYNVRAKLFFAYSKHWNFLQRWQVNRVLNSGQGNTKKFVDDLRRLTQVIT